MNIVILSDMVDEPVKEFDITLERTTGLDPRISLQPVNARIIINDDNECKYNSRCIKNIRFIATAYRDST